MIGGMVSWTVLTLVVIPAVYGLVKGGGLPKAGVLLEPDEAARRHWPPKSHSLLSGDLGA